MNDTVLLVVILLIILDTRQCRLPSPASAQLYACDPVNDISSLLQNPGTFKSLFLMEPHRFLADIVSRMIPHVLLMVVIGHLIWFFM